MLHHFKNRAGLMSKPLYPLQSDLETKIKLQALEPKKTEFSFAEMLLSLRQSNSTDTNLSYECSISPDESESETHLESPPQSVQVSPLNSDTSPKAFVFPEQPVFRREGILEMSEFNLATHSEDSTWSMSSQTKRLRTDLAVVSSLPCSYDGSLDNGGIEANMIRFNNNNNKLSRGRYKCSRCGALKTNHLCALVEDLVLVHSQGTQVAPNIVDLVNGEPVFRERTLTVRNRSSIQN